MLGRPLLTSRLRLLFTLANGTTDVPDATGLIGHYAQGNEPSHHVIFWWFRLGQPAVAYELLERAMAFYTDQARGIHRLPSPCFLPPSLPFPLLTLARGGILHRPGHWADRQR